VRFGVKSDKGIVRDINEDSFNVLAGYPNVPISFIIADGMGGHNSGEVASQMAVDFVSNYIMESPEAFTDEKRISEAICDVIEKANSKIFSVSSEQNENTGMGTTLVMAILCGKKIYFGHVGDSRAYVLREGIINQITTDHSFIEELVKNGSISRKEAMTHPKRNLITRALGCYEKIEVDIYTCNVKENDVYILCTDGLTNLIEDSDMKDILENFDDPEAACSELVGLANSRGGDDNITVIVFKTGKTAKAVLP